MIAGKKSVVYVQNKINQVKMADHNNQVGFPINNNNQVGFPINNNNNQVVQYVPGTLVNTYQDLQMEVPPLELVNHCFERKPMIDWGELIGNLSQVQCRGALNAIINRISQNNVPNHDIPLQLMLALSCKAMYNKFDANHLTDKPIYIEGQLNIVNGFFETLDHDHIVLMPPVERADSRFKFPMMIPVRANQNYKDAKTALFEQIGQGHLLRRANNNAVVNHNGVVYENVLVQRGVRANKRQAQDAIQRAMGNHNQ